MYQQPAGNTSTNNENKNMWELCKENIQPLSHGRKIALLTQSLSSGTGLNGSQALGDHEIMETFEEFEREIRENQTNDPLEVWVRYVAYFEQNCLCTGKYQTRYNDLLKNCVRNFVNQKEWKNDKRFVNIFLKGFNSTTAERRAVILHNALNQGVGVGVSRMYIQIAEDYELLKKYIRASEVLELGRQNNAEPMEYLEEFSLNFQVRVAEMISRQIKGEENMNEGQDTARTFGASVPIGPENDPQNIRTGLAISEPSRARPALGSNGVEPKKVTVYEQKENEIPKNKLPQNIPSADSVRDIELGLKDKLDKENTMEPSKWNNPETILNLNSNNPVPVSRPAEVIQIYEDSENPIVIPERVTARKTARPVLIERKEPEIIILDEKEKPTVVAAVLETPLPIPTPKPNALVVQPPAPNPTFVTAPPSNPTVTAPTATQNQSQSEDKGPVPPGLTAGQRLACRFKDLWVNGKEVTFEHLRVAEYRKRKMGEKDQVVQSENQVLPSIAEPSPTPPEENPRIKELETENASLKNVVAQLENRIKLCELGAEQERINHAKQMESFLQKYKIMQSQQQNDENNVENIIIRQNHDSKSIHYAPTENIRLQDRVAAMGQEAGETEVIFKRNANVEQEFDLSNLTRALNFHPPPIHNSTPERTRQDETNRTNGGGLLKPQTTLFAPETTTDAPPTNYPIYQRSNFNQSMHVVQNLSTIQENSKESRSSTTSSSGSTANFTKSAQRTAARSQLVTSTIHSQLPMYQDWTN